MLRIAIISLISVGLVLCAKLVVAQDDLNTIRATIAADLPDNTEGEISPADLRGVLIDFTDIIVPISTVRGEIAPWARFAPVGTVPNNVLPNYLRTGNFQPVASWAQLLSPSGRAPLSALPVQLSYIPAADCTDGQVWIRGASVWGCGTPTGGGGGGLSTAQVRTQVSTMLLTGTNIGFTRTGTGASQTVTIGLTGIVPDANIPAGIARDTELPATTQLLTANQRVTLGRFPVAACSNGQVLKMSGAIYACAADDDTDTLPASWALATSPTGTAPANRLGLSPANGEFLVATGSTTSNWRSVQDADIPNSLARDAEIETWAIQATTGAGAIIPATVIDRALTRDADLPSALLGTALQGQTVGHCFQRVAGADGTLSQTRLLFGFAACGTGGGGSATRTIDESHYSVSLARTDMSTAAQQITLAETVSDPQHQITVSSGCLVIGATGAGWYSYDVDFRATPNKSDDADPSDENGPHRMTPTFSIQRTRSSVNTTLMTSRQTIYLRGFTANQTPASMYVHDSGRFLAVAGDTYCLMADATAASAHQADYLTLDDGELLILSERIE